ncbi:MAG: HDOD domain-containing protein [Candidatus Eisenbacteria bacterium]
MFDHDRSLWGVSTPRVISIRGDDPPQGDASAERAPREIPGGREASERPAASDPGEEVGAGPANGLPLRVIQEVAEITKACSFPRALLHVLEVTTDVHADKHKLARALEGDPDLAKRVVSVARSPLYLTHGDRIDQSGIDTYNLPNAIMKIGFAGVRNIAFTQSICVLAREGHRLSEAIATHSIVVAEIARALGWQAHVALGEDAYLAGLLHDYGKLALLRSLGTEYLHVATWCDRGRLTTLEAERDIVAPSQRHLRDHTHAGAEILRLQGLPDMVVLCARRHHDDPRDHIDGWKSWSLTGIVIAADRLAYEAGYHDGLAVHSPWAESVEELRALLGKRPAELEDFVQAALDRARATLAGARIHPETHVMSRIGELHRSTPPAVRTLPNLAQPLNAEYATCLTLIDLARQLERFTLADMQAHVLIDSAELRTWLERLLARGYLTRIPEGPGNAASAGTLDGESIGTFAATPALIRENPVAIVTALGVSEERWTASQDVRDGVPARPTGMHGGRDGAPEDRDARAA